MKRIVFLLTVAGIIMGFGFARAADFKPACVDLERAMGTCDIGKKLNNEIQQDIEKAKQKLTGMDQDLKKLREVLDRQSLAMNEDVKQEKLKEYQTKARDLERLAKDSEEDLRQKYAERRQKLLQDFVDVIKEYGKERGYSMIIEKGPIIYAVDSMDITDEVIRAFDEKFSPKAAEKPQPKENGKTKGK